jgi:predicted AlkP superfamily phosphohydrolase/phosphomutase
VSVSFEATGPAAVRRTLVIGLDGATWDVIDPLLARGELPALAGLLRRGTRAHLRSTIPPVTAAAWPSIVTGKNPGRHGLFGFRTIPLSSGADEREFVSSRSIAGQTWFDGFGQAGQQVLAYRVPLTYPVWPVNGSMVAGFPTPDLGPYTYPDSLGPQLKEIRPQDHGIHSFEELHLAGPAEVLTMGDLFLEALEADVGRFLDDPKYRLLMFVVSLNDYLQHRFWALHEAAAGGTVAVDGQDDPIAEFYRRQDASIGHLLQRLDDEDLVMLVSDHGGGAKGLRVFNPNAWLAEQGLFAAAGVRAGLAMGFASAGLRAAREGAKALGLTEPIKRGLAPLLGRAAQRARALADAVDWTATRAYYTPLFYPAAGIHLNVRGRQTAGLVEPGADNEALRDRLLVALRELRDPRGGAPVVEEAYRREELYEGEHVQDAPDIVFVTDPVYQTWSRVTSPFLDAPRPGAHDWHGDHRMDGVLCLTGPGVFRAGARLEGASVMDVAPTLFHSAGLPVPCDMDGRVLEEAFESDFRQAQAVRRGAALDGSFLPPREYSEAEEAGIRAALQGLGYIE